MKVSFPQLVPAPKSATATAPPKPAVSIVKRLDSYLKQHGPDHADVQHWKAQQANSSWSDGAMAYKSFLLSNMKQKKEKDFFWGKKGHAAKLAKASAGNPQGYRDAMIAHHALVQEALESTAFTHNDQTARKVRIFRTEKTSMGLQQGTPGKLVRGVNESGSVFRPVIAVAGPHVTVQAVPYHRITGMYFMEQGPGMGSCGFLGDSENEFTFLPHDLDVHYTGTTSSPQNLDAGNDSTLWNP